MVARRIFTASCTATKSGREKADQVSGAEGDRSATLFASTREFYHRLEARDLLVANIPDVFNQLLGHKNARRGILKVLDALQDERLNKQLFYDLLEVILKDGFPELSGL